MAAEYFKRWPNQDGEVDVYAVRDAKGDLTGLDIQEARACQGTKSGAQGQAVEVGVRMIIPKETRPAEASLRALLLSRNGA